MQAFDDIKKYIDIVCEQIRWKKARPIIAAEIENHMLDQRDAYIHEGLDENEAVKTAVLQMGDAVLIGQELDKAHKPKPQWTMIVLVGIFMIIGMLLDYMVNSSENLSQISDIIPFALALGIFIVCYFIDFSFFGKYNFQFYFFILAFSIVGTFMINSAYGPSNWNIGIRIGNYGISIHFLSLIYPFAFSLLVYSARKKGYAGIILSGLGFLPLAIFLVHVSMAGLVIYTVSSLLILFISICKGYFGVNKKLALLLFLIPVLIIIILAGLVILENNYRFSTRFLAVLNPEEYKNVSGYIYYIIRHSLSNAPFVGRGIKTPENTYFLSFPSAKTDYSLVYLVHQFGFIALIGILMFIILFAVIGIYKGLKEKSILGSLITLSISFTFLFQSILYIIHNLGYGLIAPLTLPFISYGKSALFINSALAGFMLSIFRTGDVYRDKSIIDNKKTSAFHTNIES